MKHWKEILLNILMSLSGPLLTISMILAGKGFKIKGEMFVFAGIATAIAFVVSIAIHSINKWNYKKSIIASVIGIEIVYALLAVFDAMRNPKSMMWLPIALLFLPLFTLPTAISVSFGIGRIFEVKKRRRCLSCRAEVNPSDNYCIRCGAKITLQDIEDRNTAK